MKSRIADIGCYCLVALTLLGCIVSLATSASGRMILGIVFGIIGLLVLVIIPHNIRIRRVRKIFRS